MSQQLALAVVGCGDIAGYTAMVSRLVREVRLAACCDLDPERARRFARRHGVAHVSSRYEELLTREDVDAVYLAVPHHLHSEMISAAVAAQKPVLVEKPLTRTLDEGVAVVERAARLGVKVGVNYQYRYARACHTLARAVQAVELGRIRSARINVPWHREAAYFEGSPWHRTIARAGGGTLITQGSHFLDVVLWALGSRPVSAVGYTARPGFEVEVETLAHGVVELADGALVQISSSMVAAQERAVTIEVYGDRGTAEYRNRPIPRVRFLGVKPAPWRPPVRGVHALQRSLAGFARWVLKDEPYLIPAPAALPVLAAVEAIYRSAGSGRREEVATLPSL